MTRIATKLAKTLKPIKPVTRERLWWFAEVHGLVSGISVQHVSSLIPDGSRIEKVVIESHLQAGADNSGLHVAAAITRRQTFTINDLIQDRQILWWTQIGSDQGWYPMGLEYSQQYDVNMLVTGSDQRLGVVITNVTGDVVDVRVGIGYKLPE